MTPKVKINRLLTPVTRTFCPGIVICVKAVITLTENEVLVLPCDTMTCCTLALTFFDNNSALLSLFKIFRDQWRFSRLTRTQKEGTSLEGTQMRD